MVETPLHIDIYKYRFFKRVKRHYTSNALLALLRCLISRVVLSPFQPVGCVIGGAESAGQENEGQKFQGVENAGLE